MPTVNLDDDTVFVVPTSEAIEVLGLDSSLDGEVPDAYSIVLDESSGMPWVPVFIATRTTGSTKH